jgi:hypothetical protein
LDHSRITSLGGTYEANVTAEVDQVHLRHSFRLLRCTLHFRDGPGFGAAGDLTIADKPKHKIAPPRETTNLSIGLS